MNFKLKEKLEKFYDENVWLHKTIGEIIEECADVYGDNIALVDRDIEYSYIDLNKESNIYANKLLNAELNKGDKVLLQFPNCSEFVILLLAMLKVGIIPVLLLPAHRENEIIRIIKKVKPKAYISISSYLGFSYVDMISGIEKEINNKFDIYILGENQNYKNFYKLNDKDYLYHKPKLNYKDLALLMLSSGTTGDSKIIPIRHCELLCCSKDIGKALDYSDSTICLSALSLSHIFALSYPGIIGSIYYGAKCILSTTPSPEEILSNVEKYKVNTMALVPTLAGLCIDFIKFSEFDISSLKSIQIGGAVLDYYRALEIEKYFNCTLVQTYGMTEGLVMCTRLDDNKETRIYTQGKPVSNGDVAKVMGENGNETEIGEFGELLVRGPYTIYEYYGETGNYSDLILDESLYFKTGDKARKLPDGNYQIVGRLKETIIRGGEKIIPSELENILLKSNKISEVQVIGIPDKLLGEKICIFILDKDKDLRFSEIISILKNQGVAEFKLPDCMKIVDKWPLTATGKINRKKLLEECDDKKLEEESE